MRSQDEVRNFFKSEDYLCYQNQVTVALYGCMTEAVRLTRLWLSREFKRENRNLCSNQQLSQELRALHRGFQMRAWDVDFRYHHTLEFMFLLSHLLSRTGREFFEPTEVNLHQKVLDVERKLDSILEISG